MKLYDNYTRTADLILQKLNEQNQVDLYPVQEENEQNELRSIYSTQYKNDILNRQISSMIVGLKEDIITKVFFTSVIEPILEHYIFNNRSYTVAYNLLREHYMDKDIDSVLREMKYKNIYLSEMASTINNIYYTILEDANKIKEGLSAEQINKIEKSNIDDLVGNFNNKVPTDISNKIISRIDKGIQDFIDHQRDQRSKLQSIYDKAQEKMEMYNQAQSSNAMFTDPNDDQDLNNDYDLDNKLDAQDTEQTINTPKDQLMQQVKAQESTILSEGYNVFEAMVRILTESTYHNETLSEMYNKNYQMIINDAKTMYIVMESLNTMGMEEFNDKKIEDLLVEMGEEMNNNNKTLPIKDPSTKVPSSSTFSSNNISPVASTPTSSDIGKSASMSGLGRRTNTPA